MAEAVAAAAAVVLSIEAFVWTIQTVKRLQELRLDALGSIDKLLVLCKGYESLLRKSVNEDREHEEIRLTRRRMASILAEVKEYIDEKLEKLGKPRRRPSHLVERVAKKVDVYYAGLNSLWAQLVMTKELPMYWLDSSETGGIQYACASGWSFGRTEARRRLAPDSRLDLLLSKVRERAMAPVVGGPHSADTEPSIILVHGRPSIGKTVLCGNVLEAPGVADCFPGGCIYLPMSKDGLTEEEFARDVRDYIVKCIPRQCKYLPPSGADGPMRIDDVVDFFQLLVRSRRCIFLLDDLWPRRRCRNGLRWESDPLNSIMKLASRDSLVLVSSSHRRAVEVEKYQDTGGASVYNVPLAERTLMELAFCEGWNQEALGSKPEIVIGRVSDLDASFASVLETVLASCGGLPGAAFAAGGVLFRRKLADEDDATILQTLRGEVSHLMNPGIGLPEELKAKLDRTVKLCGDSIDHSYQFAMDIYKFVGQAQGCRSERYIENWRGECQSLKYQAVDSVVQVPIADVASGGGYDIAKVKRGVNELNKYLPISATSDANAMVLICSLFYDHAKSLSRPVEMNGVTFAPMHECMHLTTSLSSS